MKSAITLVILGLVGAAAVSAQQAQAGVRPVASVLQLHAVMINSSSDAVFGAAGDPPATDAAWLQASGQALVLAESGNLVMLGGRARDNAAWMRLSRAMVDAAAAAAAAAEQKNPDALAAAGDATTASCEACHQPYRDGGRRMEVPQ